MLSILAWFLKWKPCSYQGQDMLQIPLDALLGRVPGGLLRVETNRTFSNSK